MSSCDWLRTLPASMRSARRITEFPAMGDPDSIVQTIGAAPRNLGSSDA